METPEWETSDKDDGYKEHVTCEPDIIVNEVWVNGKSVWKKGETMFNRTFEVPQKSREVEKCCENCSSYTPPKDGAESGRGRCHKTPQMRDVWDIDWCEQHTIKQELFRDEMPDKGVAE